MLGEVTKKLEAFVYVFTSVMPNCYTTAICESSGDYQLRIAAPSEPKEVPDPGGEHNQTQCEEDDAPHRGYRDTYPFTKTESASQFCIFVEAE
jgi:hypothetical protein